jgi:hypothetical protein
LKTKKREGRREAPKPIFRALFVFWCTSLVGLEHVRESSGAHSDKYERSDP